MAPECAGTTPDRNRREVTGLVAATNAPEGHFTLAILDCADERKADRMGLEAINRHLADTNLTET